MLVVIMMVCAVPLSASAGMFEDVGSAVESVYGVLAEYYYQIDEEVEKYYEKLESGEIDIYRYDNKFAYTIADNEIEIISGLFDLYSESTVVIPAEINGLPVTSIGDFAFEDLTNMTKLVIPNSVLKIGMGACASCSRLENVSFSDNLRSIGDFAFADCDLKSLDFGESLIEIGVAAFHGCYKIEELNIPDNVTDISDFAFFQCENLKKVTLGENTQRIGKGAFSQCIYLENISNGKNIKYIDDGAFISCVSLKNVDVNETLESVGNAAFISCYMLENISSAKEIGEYAYAICLNLEDIVIDEYVESVGKGAFLIASTVENIYVYSKDISLEDTSVGYAAYLINGMSREDYAYKSSQGAIASYWGDEETSMNIDAELAAHSILLEEPQPVNTIHCYKDSTAEAYAKANGFEYILFENYVASAETEANCIVKGSVTYTCPCGCGDSYETESDYNKDKHGELYLINEVKASCKADGYSGDIYCRVCGDCVELGHVIGASDHVDADKNDICDNCNADMTPSCDVHTPKTIEWAATCTTDGFRYEICSVCGDVLGDLEPIPAGHKFEETNRINPSCTKNGKIEYTCQNCPESYEETLLSEGHKDGEWVTEVYATYEAEGKKVIRCTVCNVVLDEEVIPKLIKPVVVDKKTGIEIEYDGDYEGEVGIDVKETFDGAAFNIVGKENSGKETKIFDISMLVDGKTVQPNGKVKVKIPVPQGFDPNECKVYYVNIKTGKIEEINSYCENGYIIFETDHFSYYAIVDESSKIEEPPVADDPVEPDEPDQPSKECSCNCHKGGIAGFFWKIANFFNKLFKIKSKQMCTCGVAHY